MIHTKYIPPQIDINKTKLLRAGEMYGHSIEFALVDRSPEAKMYVNNSISQECVID